MSFSSTPLGQGRRLDHHTFLNKNNPNAPQRRVIPASYSYGAPTVGSRSPPKPDKAPLPPPDDPEEPALVRFARLKQREQVQQSGPSSHPEKWPVRDTSVNIVSAFHQAASTSLDTTADTSGTNTSIMNPNEAWASGIRKQPMVPRSTSVEYEKETQSTINRRLAPPPNRLQQARVARPVSKTASVRHVPDSEGEEEVQPNGRAKTPLEQGIDMISRIVPASFLLRERSREPEESFANGGDTRDQSSYDYSAEEREFQSAAASQKPPSRRTVAAHRKGRMSTDNKAYRPSMSDLEESDEDFAEDGKRTRRKKKKGGPTGGPLTTLPIAGYDKRKRKKKGTRENGAGGEEEEEESSEEEERMSELRSQRGTTPLQRPPSIARGSVPPQARQPSVQPQYDSGIQETSTDLEGGQLGPISEVDEPPPMIDGAFPPTKSSFSVGAALGKMVNTFAGAILSIIRAVFGSFAQLARVVVRLNLIKYVLIAATIYFAWAALNSGMLDIGAIPSIWVPRTPYQPPSIPASDLAALSARLQTLEKAFASLSLDTDKSRVYIDSDIKHRAEVIGRLGSLETRFQKESSRALDAEGKHRAAASEGFNAVKKEISQLSSQLQTIREETRRPSIGSDQEARTKLKLMEDRVVSVESGVKEALDLSKSAAKAATVAGNVAQWWNGLATGKTKGVTIKSSDGQDVTSLISQIVDSAVLRTSKDTLARVDFALHSAGANIIPARTSDTLEVRPSGLIKQISGLVFGGNGYAIGRPPVTALHHELHTGHCWPFAGSQGQLGVALAAPVYITDVTIDHAPKELAMDMRSAPRQMELWGLVEGKDNLAKLFEWRTQRAAEREATQDAGQPVAPSLVDDVDYPRTLPRYPDFIRIANFTYDIHAPHYIQTFPVRDEIRELGIDFGVVVLFVKSNWGMDEFTCLYRLRVHGERMGEVPLPYPEEEESA